MGEVIPFPGFDANDPETEDLYDAAEELASLAVRRVCRILPVDRAAKVDAHAEAILIHAIQILRRESDDAPDGAA